MNEFATEKLARILKPGKQGTARLSFCEVDRMESLSSMIHGGPVGFCHEGRYLKLTIDGEGTVMSNTRMERISNWEVVAKAHGRTLIAGLGMAMILIPILAKKEVERVTVVEKNRDVVRLIKPQLRHQRKLTVVEADINAWRPDRATRFNVIYFDIWSAASINNLDEVARLHNRFKYHLDRSDPNCWMDSWMAKQLRSDRKDERRTRW